MPDRCGIAKMRRAQVGERAKNAIAKHPQRASGLPAASRPPIAPDVIVSVITRVEPAASVPTVQVTSGSASAQ